MAYLHGTPVASPAQSAVHDQAAADSLIEDTDHYEVWIGVVDLVDSQHRKGVDVVLDYHRDGPAGIWGQPRKDGAIFLPAGQDAWTDRAKAA